MNKEPFFRITKNDKTSKTKSISTHIVAAILALIVCGIVIVAITKQNPIDVYEGIIDGAIGTKRRILVTVRETVILLLIAVGLTPAFKMRFWNIGAEGQILVGGLASAAVMIYLSNFLPNGVLIPLMILSSILAGMLWGFIPSVFKAHYNTNETLFTLMLNYVAMQMVTFCVIFWENPAGSNSVGIINGETKKGWFPELFGNSQWLCVLIVLAITVGMFIYMKYSKQGYEISVVGESEHTAKYIGISVNKVIIRTVMLSGAICGLAGALIVGGSSHTISTSTAGGRGFTAIIVAWMSKFNPFVMILVSAFLAFMQQGAVQIASQFGLNQNASDIITGIILFFLIGCEFFTNYKVDFGKKAKEVH